jgi:hypothetical protein
MLKSLLQNTKLEKLLIQCKEAIKTHQEKQVGLIIERDKLLQQLNEKQTFIESLMKVCFVKYTLIRRRVLVIYIYRLIQK